MTDNPDPPVEVVTVPHDSVLVLRGDVWTDELMAQMAPHVAALLVRLPESETIEALDVDVMREHGWVRADG